MVIIFVYIWLIVNIPYMDPMGNISPPVGGFYFATIWLEVMSRSLVNFVAPSSQPPPFTGKPENHRLKNTGWEGICL